MSRQAHPSGPVLAVAAPRELDALLRWAGAAVTGRSATELPSAQPRRAPSNALGEYTSSVPMRLAGQAHRPARELAAEIAAALRDCPQVVDARVRGPGFVDIAIEPGTRAALAQVVAEDPDSYLIGRTSPASASPRRPRKSPDAHPGWELSRLERAPALEQARMWARADARRRIALATDPGSAPDILTTTPHQAETAWCDTRHGALPDAAATPTARLLAAIGPDSARFAFCRGLDDQIRPGESTGPNLPALPTAQDPGAWARHTDANPAFAVRYAHAHARTACDRWAPALGHKRAPKGRAYPESASAALTEPAAETLLGALFTAPAAVQAAARRSEPHILVRYLEGLRAAYHEWWESCDVIPGRDASTGADGEYDQVTAARLDVCVAVAGIVRRGLSLIGVSAPTRL